MKLSAPVYSLKRLAKDLSREKKIPLHAALDRVAQDEGFTSWGLLAARLSAEGPAGKLFDQLRPGDLVLIGARPGHGKTLMGLELAVRAAKSGRQGRFFTLEWTSNEFQSNLRDMGEDPSTLGEALEFDSSDSISAGHIIECLSSAPSGTLAVVDYLQILDQKRENPELALQIRTLKSYARDRELIIVVRSQINRLYDPASRPLPGLADVRLPNPLDLSLFDRTCFLHNGKVQISANRTTSPKARPTRNAS